MVISYSTPRKPTQSFCDEWEWNYVVTEILSFTFIIQQGPIPYTLIQVGGTVSVMFLWLPDNRPGKGRPGSRPSRPGSQEAVTTFYLHKGQRIKRTSAYRASQPTPVTCFFQQAPPPKVPTPSNTVPPAGDRVLKPGPKGTSHQTWASTVTPPPLFFQNFQRTRYNRQLRIK